MSEGLCIEINGGQIEGIGETGGGKGGNAHATITEIVTLGGSGFGYVIIPGLLRL